MPSLACVLRCQAAVYLYCIQSLLQGHLSALEVPTGKGPALTIIGEGAIYAMLTAILSCRLGVAAFLSCAGRLSSTIYMAISRRNANFAALSCNTKVKASSFDVQPQD